MEIAVRVLDGQADQVVAEARGGAVGPGELREQDDLDAHGLAPGDGVFELLERPQARVRVVRRVALVLAAVVPADQLDGLDAVPGALLGHRGQVGEAQAQLVLGRVDVELLPGVRLARPGGDGGRFHPGVAPRSCRCRRRPASRPRRPRSPPASGRVFRRAGCRARARRRSGCARPGRRSTGRPARAR